MRIAMVTGSYPPEVCGVGDYTYNLVQSLQKEGMEVEVIHFPSWSIPHLPKIIKRINRIQPDLVHIQYPTVGYGFHLVPHLLSMYYQTVITLHEVSQVHVLRQLSLWLFSKKSNFFVFTNTFEKDYAFRFAPWIKRNARIIPIGSNIPRGNQAKNRQSKEIIYFGLIREKKGLEDVVALAKLMDKEKDDYQIRMVGVPDPRSAPYLEHLYQETKDLPVIWDLGKEAEEVADILSRASLGYLPFPDGASERRGSMLALLINGVHTITTKGPFTPQELERVVSYAANPQEALTFIRAYFAKEKAQGQELGDYGKQFLWEEISKKHKALYQEIMEAKR